MFVVVLVVLRIELKDVYENGPKAYTHIYVNEFFFRTKDGNVNLFKILNLLVAFMSLFLVMSLFTLLSLLLFLLVYYA